MLYYLAWGVPSILFCVFVSWASVKNFQAPSPFWTWVLILTGLFPGWAIVTRYSKNLLFDAMLYDVILFLTFATSIGVMNGDFVRFSPWQWLGLALIVAGFLLVRLK